MRRLRARLEDVLEAITGIEEVAAQGRDVFDTDPRAQVWIIHHLQLIGEAIRPHVEELAALRPDVPWAQVVGMRHILVHRYFQVELEDLWGAVERDLPALRAAVEALLAQLPPDG